MSMLFQRNAGETTDEKVNNENPLAVALYDQYGTQTGTASAPLATRPPNDLVYQGTLTALNDALTVLLPNGAAVVGVEMTAGLTGGAVITPEGTIDGTTWRTVLVQQLTGQDNNNFTPAAASVAFRAAVGGLAAFRLRVSTGGTGVSLVTARVSMVPGATTMVTGLGTMASLSDATSTPLVATLGSLELNYNGATWSYRRVATGVSGAAAIPFKTVSAVAITATTGATIWTPASGKKFRLMGYCFSVSAAASLKFYDGVGGALTTLIFLSPLLAAAGTHSMGAGDLGNGILSATANNTLALDVSGNATVTGTVFGVEE